MKVKVSTATCAALGWMVAKAAGSMAPVGNVMMIGTQLFITVKNDLDTPGRWVIYSPSTDWGQGGPILEQEWLDVTPWPNESEENKRWDCVQHDCNPPYQQFGPTPLIAAMRCYVASKLGEEVDVPEELT